MARSSHTLESIPNSLTSDGKFSFDQFYLGPSNDIVGEVKGIELPTRWAKELKDVEIKDLV